MLLLAAVLAFQHRRTGKPRVASQSDLPGAGRLNPAAGKSFGVSNAGAVRSGKEVLPAALLQALSDPDVSVRLDALRQLAALKKQDSEVIATLIACLSDPEASVRAFAVARLGAFRMAASDAVPRLKELARDDPNEQVRSRARDALYNIRLYDYSPLLREL